MISKNYNPAHYPKGNWVIPENPKVKYLGYKDVGPIQKLFFLVMQIGAHEKHGTINVFKTLGHLRGVMKYYTMFFAMLYQGKTKIEHDEKEKCIERAAWRLGCIYEYSHHRPFLIKAGHTDAEIRTWAEEDDPSWDDRTRTLFKCVDDIIENHKLSDENWDALKKYYNDDQMVEFCMLIGHYIMIAVTVNSTGTQLEDDKWL